MARKRRNKLERIFLVNPSRDDYGRYLNYCTYPQHPGIIPGKKARKCRNRSCKYYRMYREREW
jgi:hypothetical protein